MCRFESMLIAAGIFEAGTEVYGGQSVDLPDMTSRSRTGAMLLSAILCHSWGRRIQPARPGD